jgi:hypothetical protein
MKEEIDKTVDRFIEKYGNKCRNELASLAFFHLFFFEMLKGTLQDYNIKLDRRTIISNHTDKSPILEFSDGYKTVKCEFGDLFLVNKMGNHSKAIVIQAKQNNVSYSKGSTRKEKYLYNNWPEFKIVKPQGENSKFNLLIETESLSRFLTFFSKSGNLKIGDSQKQELTFAAFFEDFLKIDRSETGRCFKTVVEQRKYKIKNIFCQNDGLKITCKSDFDDWNKLCNWVLDYFSTRKFTNVQTRLNEKQSINQLYFLNNKCPQNIDNIIINNDELFQRKEELNFFSLITITSL